MLCHSHRVVHDAYSCCAWFKSFAVHAIEKASLPEFFDGTKYGKHGVDVSINCQVIRIYTCIRAGNSDLILMEEQ